MSEPRKFFQGTLRTKIKPLGLMPEGFHHFEIEWVDSDTREVVWQERVKVPPGNAFVSQIEVTGYARPKDTFFVDEDGKRHFVLRAEPFSFGIQMG